MHIGEQTVVGLANRVHPLTAESVAQRRALAKRWTTLDHMMCSVSRQGRSSLSQIEESNVEALLACLRWLKSLRTCSDH